MWLEFKCTTMAEVIEKEVKKIGTGSHVVLPKSWRGRRVRVEPLDEPED